MKTHEELRKECAEILAESAVKSGISHSKEYYLSTFEENKNKPTIKSAIDAMMEVAAKAWEQASKLQLQKDNSVWNYWQSGGKDEDFPFTELINNPYIKPDHP